VLKRRRHFSLRRQGGVSLIESLGVVVVAGSLSAVALPKLADLPTEARMAVVHSMAGAVHSASALVHMKCAVQSGCDMVSGSASVLAAGDAVSLIRGYPKGGDASGIENALEYGGFTALRSPGRTVFVKDGAPHAPSCAVIYDEPLADGRRPTIEAVTAGC
jgi:MSHA pilin protein MshA